MKNQNTVLMSKKYRDKWVALESNSGNVVGVGKTAKVAFEESQKKGVKEPILTKIPKNYGTSYVLITTQLPGLPR